MTERERERHRDILTKYALPPYDFITDDMTVPFAIELAEKDAEIERLRSILRDARDHVPWDVLKRIDAALGASRAEQTGDAK